MDEARPGKIKSVYRLSRIVEHLRRNGPCSVTEIAGELDASRSTAHAYLSTMHDLEYVVKTDRGYDLSLKFLEPGMDVRNARPIVKVGEPIVEQLAQDTNEATWLIVEEHGKAVYVDLALGERAVHTKGGVGKRAPLHTLAAGKAIIAHLPDERVEEIIATEGLPKQTDRTIATEEELLTELERVRDRGYALNDHESIKGARAVAAPVLVDGAVRGAISVSGPAHRVTEERLEEEIVGSVLAAANELELKLANPA